VSKATKANGSGSSPSSTSPETALTGTTLASASGPPRSRPCREQ
jgi:hypothetical protein